MNTPSPCDVVCVGLIVADHVCAPIDAYPPPGGLVTTPRLELTIGGCAANVSVDLSKLGVPVALVGCVGEDVFGRHVREELGSHGVRCGHVVASKTAQTSGTMVINVKGEDRRFIHAVGANTELTGREVSDDLLRQAKIVYVGGFGLNAALSGENVADLFRRARGFGVTTVLDVVLNDPQKALRMTRTALPETDIFLPNTDEARLMTGLTAPFDQARTFAEWGARTVVVTLGEKGALMVQNPGEPAAREPQDSIRRSAAIHVPAHPVEQIDGTGGGDAFVSGFLYGLLHGHPYETCLTYGSAMGASCVRSAGATTGVFNAPQLEQYVREHPLPVHRAMT